MGAGIMTAVNIVKISLYSIVLQHLHTDVGT
jgi:hypothetical protein